MAAKLANRTPSQWDTRCFILQTHVKQQHFRPRRTPRDARALPPGDHPVPLWGFANDITNPMGSICGMFIASMVILINLNGTTENGRRAIYGFRARRERVAHA